MIALIDCNNFYCSCERVFQPALAGRPLIVLSNNDGCAIARSEEAKALNIKMAQPAFMIENIVKEHKVAVHSSNYTLYDNMSRRVMEVIRSFVPRTEVYSIDEIFADLSGMKYVDLAALGSSIRTAVGEATGIPVSVGIAATKALAKMANRHAKKARPAEGVFVAAGQSAVDTMLRQSAVGEIWGIGKQLESVLESAGFATAYDFAYTAPEEWVRKELTVVGQRLYNELRGISCFPWEEARPVRQNICTSRSFGKLIRSKRELRQAVAKFTAACGEKLRSEQTCARKLQVFIKTNPHRPTDAQYEQSITMDLPQASNLTPTLMKLAMRGLDLLFREGYNYQKAGVIVMDLVPQSEVQLALFENAPAEKEKKLMASVDQVNRSFGRDTVRFGVHDYGKEWHLKRQHLSPGFTTSLQDLPKAK